MGGACGGWQAPWQRTGTGRRSGRLASALGPRALLAPRGRAPTKSWLVWSTSMLWLLWCRPCVRHHQKMPAGSISALDKPRASRPRNLILGAVWYAGHEARPHTNEGVDICHWAPAKEAGHRRRMSRDDRRVVGHGHAVFHARGYGDHVPARLGLAPNSSDGFWRRQLEP